MSDPASARWLLREATGDLHADLDGLLSRVEFDDRRSYGDFLLRQAGPLFTIERLLNEGPAFDELDWRSRTRTQAMRADLTMLDLVPPAALPSKLRIENRDAALGLLYVLEGSRLGAKILLRRARASRDPLVRTATAYLAHGEDRPFWQTYLKTLERIEERGLDTTRLVQGARAAFALFLETARDGSVREAKVIAG